MNLVTFLSSYIKNRPSGGIRSDFGDEELLGLCFDPSDEELINIIKSRESRKTKMAKLRYEKKKIHLDR